MVGGEAHCVSGFVNGILNHSLVGRIFNRQVCAVGDARSVDLTKSDVLPIGHSARLRVFVDPNFLQYDEMWAAAGTWNDGDGIAPQELVDASGGALTGLKRG